MANIHIEFMIIKDTRYGCRAATFVRHVRASTKVSEQLRRLQVEAIRAEAEGEDVHSDTPTLSAKEVMEDEAEPRQSVPRRRRVLQLVAPVETRWNSKLYMVQR